MKRHSGRCCIGILTTWIIALQAPLAGEPSSGEQRTSPEVTLPALAVRATREAWPNDRAAVAVDAFDAERLRDSSALTLDDALRGSTAFSLFRRSSSLTAHPTAQGASLRGLGPSGASRSLVLLDDVPLNDPFGGWIVWSKVPRLGLDSVEIVRGGGSGVWGNAALGGVVHISSAFIEPDSGRMAVDFGEYSTFRAEAIAGVAVGRNATATLGGRRFSTKGFYQYAKSRRGTIDRPLESEHGLLHGDYALSLPSEWRFSSGFRLFDESRGNGTPLQENASSDAAFRAQLSGPIGDAVSLNVVAYGQRQHLESFFSSVDAARASEIPALDQFDVPSSAYGVAAVASIQRDNEAVTTFGGDFRHVSGETKEDFFFSAGAFQRRRVAGGEQDVGGVFITHTQPMPGNLEMQLSGRLDRWVHSDGRRTEHVKESGLVTREDHFGGRSGTRASPGLGLVWRPAESLRYRAAVYQAFRVPTLNELYRPFRVGSVNTEANPALELETVTGGELGFEYAHGTTRFGAGAFHNRFEHAVANVTLSTTPSLTQRQRLNLDRVRVQGIELKAEWSPRPGLELTADYLYSDTRVMEARVAPELVGRRVAQVPRHSLSIFGAWRWRPGWRAQLGMRAVSAQFEDDENRLRLAPAAIADLQVAWVIRAGWEVGVVVENLLDEDVETTRSPDGLVSLGAPRMARGFLRLDW